MRTFSPKASDITHEWQLLDAEGAVLGRISTEIANLLRGKHKPIYAPHVDTGDHVIVINAAKIVVDPRKAESKRYYRHSGYPGGIKSRTLAEVLDRHPDRVIRQAVKGMLPKGPLGRAMIRKLRIYAGDTHPHTAQQPKPYELSARTYART